MITFIAIFALILFVAAWLHFLFSHDWEIEWSKTTFGDRFTQACKKCPDERKVKRGKHGRIDIIIEPEYKFCRFWLPARGD